LSRRNGQIAKYLLNSRIAYITVVILRFPMPKKLILNCEQPLWNEVLKYKINSGLKNNNEAVIELLKKALKAKN